MTEAERNDCAIRIHSGKRFFFLEPERNIITIEDIAWGLSGNMRFNGQGDHEIRIAEHCINVSRLVEQEAPEYALCGLMHDAAEAFLGDMTTPQKSTDADYKKMEKIHDAWFANEFGYEYPFPPVVKKYDWLCCVNEYHKLFPDVLTKERLSIDNAEPIEGLFEFKFYNKLRAYEAFLERYWEITKKYSEFIK